MDDIHKNIKEYNPNKKRKILIFKLNICKQMVLPKNSIS